MCEAAAVRTEHTRRSNEKFRWSDIKVGLKGGAAAYHLSSSHIKHHLLEISSTLLLLNEMNWSHTARGSTSDVHLT